MLNAVKLFTHATVRLRLVWFKDCGWINVVFPKQLLEKEHYNHVSGVYVTKLRQSSVVNTDISIPTVTVTV